MLGCAAGPAACNSAILLAVQGDAGCLAASAHLAGQHAAVKHEALRGVHGRRGRVAVISLQQAV